MEPRRRIGLPLSPIALATLFALVAAPAVLPVPWITSAAHASHCAPAPTCVTTCDTPPCDTPPCVCECAGCDYKPVPKIRVP